ncbi:helix-turn-helix domain-containing protein [Halococcus dombrowskii]|uniref:helix-turn-helix domain-containing protein n=1 Tax=Halococcus dombrowskii TaxID=179637 RepID=UPI0031400297
MQGAQKLLRTRDCGDSSPQARSRIRAQTRRDAEARLIKLACSDPPEGCARWTLHLLADELVTLDEIDFESISHETVRRRLKKHPQTTSLRLLGDSR